MDLTNYESINVIIGVVIVFFLIRLAVGYYASRKVKTASDFVVAGRRLPIYLTAASIMATWFAAETIMGASSTAYQWGFQGVLFDPFGAVLCLVLSGFFFIRLMRRARYMTTIDFFERRFGKNMAFLGGMTQLISYFGWTAAQIVAGGAILHALLGWPLAAGMIVVTLVVIFYTMMGGMWADTLLDFMQMFFTAGGMLLIFNAVIKQVGGWDAFLGTAGSVNVSNALTIMPIQGEGFLGYEGMMGWLYWLAAWMSLGFGSLNAQDLMQRSMSARNEATAVHGTYVAAILYGVFGILSPLTGIAMFRLFPDIGSVASEYVVISAALNYLPPALAALFIASLASALMSTSDSSLLAGASIVTENLLPLVNKGLDEKGHLRWTRWMVLIIGVGSLSIALYAGTIYRLATLTFTVLLVGQAAPFILGMYWKKANQKGVVMGFFGGFVSWLIGMAVLYPQTYFGDSEMALWDAAYISSVPAFVISMLLVVIISRLTQEIDCPKDLTDVDNQPLALRDRLGWLPLWDAIRSER